MTAISRKGSEARFPSRVAAHKIGFSEANLEAAFKGQDAVISVVGAKWDVTNTTTDE